MKDNDINVLVVQLATMVSFFHYIHYRSMLTRVYAHRRDDEILPLIDRAIQLDRAITCMTHHSRYYSQSIRRQLSIHELSNEWFILIDHTHLQQSFGLF